MKSSYEVPANSTLYLLMRSFNVGGAFSLEEGVLFGKALISSAA